MKKKFSTLALALIAAAGIGVMAQNPAPDCCKKGHGDNCDKKEAPCLDRAQADSLRATMLFDGIQLTPDQQAKINQLRADKAKARMEARKAEKQARADAAKAEKQARAEFGKARMDARKAEIKADLEKMKQILTPEQYVQYLENMVTSAPAPGRMDGKAPRHGHKDMKAAPGRADKNKGMHKQHPRPDKKNKTAEK